MKSASIMALTALLTTGAQAVPMADHKNHHAALHAAFHHKRDIVWVTKTEIETVVVRKTIFADGSEPTASTQTYGAPAQTTAPVTATSVASSSSSSAAATTPSSPAETGSQSAPAAYTTTTTSTYQAPAPTPVESSTTSAAPAYTPEPTTSSYVAPAPETTSYVPAPETTSAAPAPSATSAPGGSYSGGGSTSSGASYSGDFTHWDPAMGACGWTNSAEESVVAISHALFDPSTPGGNPNNNPLCGRTLTLKHKDGSTTSAKVVDRCVGCAEGDLDLTLSLFNTVTDNGDGRVGGMEWSWD